MYTVLIITATAMEVIILNAISRLFNCFWQYGNYSDDEIHKVLAMIVIRDMLFFDDSYLSEDNMREIEKAINMLLGESCQLPLTVGKQGCC